MAKGDRFLALVAAMGDMDLPSVMASSEYPLNPDGTMKNPKNFQYQIPSLCDDWYDIQCSRYADAFDAAEDAVEKAWNDSGETPDEETLVNIREAGSEEVLAMLVGVEFNPTFTAREVPKAIVPEPSQEEVVTNVAE